MVQYTAHECIGYFARDTRVTVTRKLARMPYAQAGILEDGRGTHLISYSTLVCTVDPAGWLTCTGTYSATTRKHIGAFMREFPTPCGYYDAKRCYERDEALNIYTGEVMPLADYARMVGAA